MSDAARRPELLMQPSGVGVVAPEEMEVPSDGAWPGEPEQLSLVLEASRFDRIVAEAAAWADRISLCLTAPQSQRGSLPWWQELLARSSKWERVHVRRPEQAEPWLLHRLHETGALALVEGGGKQVAGNLLMFARSSEIRVLLAHIPLERAVAGAAFGALLAFRGAGTSELARSCRAQAESWSRLSRIPTASEIDALAAARRSEPLPAQTLPGGPLRLITDARELEQRIERLRGAGLDATALEGGWSVGVRGFDGGVRVEFQHRSKSRAPVVLTLHAGSTWAAGNALLLEAPDGELVLGWRGGLLGHSRSKCELLWSQARLPTFLLGDAALGPAPRLALVAKSSAALAPQLGAFVRETCRLGEVFGVEPPPTLGHAVAEFGSLSTKQQTLLLWRALLGLGALEFGVATLCAAQALRDQGYVRGGAESGGLYGAVAELLAKAAEDNPAFDRPGAGQIRAIQPDVSTYVLDDWQDCLLQALPEAQTVSRRRALRLGFERAQSHWGLSGVELRPDGRLEHTLESALASALRRGLFVRAGAGGVKRNAPLSPPADLSSAYRGALGSSEDGLLAGWTRALGQLSPAQRFLITRRAGWYCRRETLESAAQRLGLTLERARQLEVEAWQAIENDSDWARTLRERLARAFAGAGFLPLGLLIAEDPWWRGVEQHPGLAEAVFESLLDGELKRVELGAPPRRELAFARFSQAELDRALESLLERAGQLPTPAAKQDVLALAAAGAEPLDPGLGEYLRDALEAQLVLDPGDPARVLRLLPPPGATLEHLPEPHGVDSEGRLRLEDAAKSAFRSARTPLALAAIAERIRQRMDVDEQALAVLLSHAPFVQRNADQYGLLARDVPGGHEAIAAALNTLVETLEQAPRALALRDAFTLVLAQVKQPWSIELVRSLIDSDPALCLSTTLDVRLSRWEHARLVAATELLCPGVPAAARPRFEKLSQLPASEPAELLQKLRTQLARLERSADSDDFVARSLARQLGDVLERLLEHVAQSSTQAQRLAQAAARYFLELTARDEDELDAPGIDRDQLLDARAVLAAVLVQLDLDWLEPRG